MKENVVDMALKYVGYPAVKYKIPEERPFEDYGTTINGFDCSGFIRHILEVSGMPIPKVSSTGNNIRHSEEFFDWYGILVHEEFRRSGDLVFFSRNGVRPTHLGILVSENEMVHSPGEDEKAVSIVYLDDYLSNHPVRFNPRKGYEQIYSKNPIGYKRPAIVSPERWQNPIK